MGNLFIGVHTYGSGNAEGTTANAYIGKWCSLAPNLRLGLGSHNPKNISTYPFNMDFKENPFLSDVKAGRFGDIETHPITRGDIHVGNDVWIGQDVTIMTGVAVGDGAVIGTQTVVTHDVQPYEIVGGVPAHHIRYRFPLAIIKKLLEIKWWNWPDEKVCRFVPLLMSGNVEHFIQEACKE